MHGKVCCFWDLFVVLAGFGKHKMKYSQIYIVEGKYGMHVGPAGRLSDIFNKYQDRFSKEDMELRLKISCNGEFIGDKFAEEQGKIDALDILSLELKQGNKIQVDIQVDKFKRKGKRLLTDFLKEVEDVVRNPRKYTIRQH